MTDLLQPRPIVVPIVEKKPRKKPDRMVFLTANQQVDIGLFIRENWIAAPGEKLEGNYRDGVTDESIYAKFEIEGGVEKISRLRRNLVGNFKPKNPPRPLSNSEMLRAEVVALREQVETQAGQIETLEREQARLSATVDRIAYRPQSASSQGRL